MKPCVGCGVEVNRYKYGKRVFCTNACYTQYRAKLSMVTVTCEVCGSQALVPRHLSRKNLCENSLCQGSHTPKRGLKPRIPICHPERKHRAKGMCYECYREFDRTRMRERSKNWRKNNPAKAKAVYQRARYGVSPEFFDTQLAKQKGLCAVCKLKKATDIDHSHETERVRGLLCGSCNRGIGLFSENVELLKSAIAYLSEWGNGS